MCESIPDRFVGDGGDPETFQRLFVSGFLEDPARHKFSLAPGVGGDDDVGDVFSEDLFFDCMELSPGLFDDDQFPVFREHRKGLQIPGLVFFSVFLRIGQCDQMTKRPGDDIFGSLYISICFFITVQNPRDIACDGWFFCDDKMFHDTNSFHSDSAH